jgi:hypothetical protein
MTSSGSMCASPNDRMPGVSMTQPDPASGNATDCDEVCRPFPTPETSPVARSASGTSRFTSVDFPTPEWPSSTVTLSTSSGATASSGSSRPEIGLGQTQNRREPARVCGDQRPFDKAGARGRVGECHHDQQLVGVGDDHALGGIGVVGGAAQDRSTVTATHDARQGVGVPGEVAHHADVVADHDRRPAQLAGPHRRHNAVGVAAERAAPSPAIDRHHHGVLGVGVVGADLRPRPRTPPRSDPDVGLVVLPAAQPLKPLASTPGRPACRPTFAGSPAVSSRWCRCPRPRPLASAVRRSRLPSPSGGRRRTATRRRAAAWR